MGNGVRSRNSLVEVELLKLLSEEFQLDQGGKQKNVRLPESVNCSVSLKCKRYCLGQGRSGTRHGQCALGVSIQRGTIHGLNFPSVDTDSEGVSTEANIPHKTILRGLRLCHGSKGVS